MIAHLRAENEAALKTILEPKQRSRLAQIVLQVQGPLAVAEPEIAARLNLGPEQVELIQAILEDYQQAQDQVWAARRERINAASLSPIDRDRVSDKARAAPTADLKTTNRNAREKRVEAEITAMEHDSERLYQEA